MKVALVQCPVWWTTDPPMGLAQIAGCLKHSGHDVSVLDLSIELYRERGEKYENAWSWEQFAFWQNPDWVDGCFKDHEEFWDRAVDRILKTQSRVIGFAVFLGSQNTALEVARRVKKAAPERIIVLGGEYFFHGDKASVLIQDPAVDAIVLGAADFTFPDLVGKIEETGSLQPCPGAVVKINGAVHASAERPMDKNLDSLPFADYTLFPLALYDDQNRIPIAASRGCVWRCAFCSTREFWKGYSYMSGDRIYAEVAHHKKLFPNRGHVEFYDITANGDVASLDRFSELLIENDLKIHWKINAIIRPEMTRELLQKMARSGCTSIIFGVESGSERVLKLMRKGYTPDVADRVLKDAHEAGIKVTGNFMFGFPGETDEDFKLTLDFLRRSRPYLDRAYPSRTFTALEEHSYLTEHLEEFGIKLNPNKLTDLYWETLDGKNNFLVRMKRCEEFCKLAAELKIDVAQGLNSALELDHWMNIAQYYQHMENDYESIRAYLNYAELDLMNAAVQAQLKYYEHKMDRDEGSLKGFPENAPVEELLGRVRATLAQARREEGYNALAALAFKGNR